MADDPGEEADPGGSEGAAEDTVAARLAREHERLTRAERQLAAAILENYPVSGLGTITAVAQAAGVSTPTVARMVQKLGYEGYGAFQAALREELEARISDPIAKRAAWAERAPDTHLLNSFTEAVIGNVRATLSGIDTAAFDRVADLIADEARHVYVYGGRITRAVADYLFLHLQVIRPRVTLIQSISNAWPHYLLDLAAGDVLLVFDVRRYENSTLMLADLAARRGARIVLFTDEWRSPAARYAEECFSARIAAPSAWDSNVAPLLLVETLIAGVEARRWPRTKERMRALEDMFDATRLFRKFT